MRSVPTARLALVFWGIRLSVSVHIWLQRLCCYEASRLATFHRTMSNLKIQKLVDAPRTRGEAILRARERLCNFRLLSVYVLPDDSTTLPREPIHTGISYGKTDRTGSGAQLVLDWNYSRKQNRIRFKQSNKLIHNSSEFGTKVKLVSGWVQKEVSNLISVTGKNKECNSWKRGKPRAGC